MYFIGDILIKTRIFAAKFGVVFYIWQEYV